MAGNSAFTASLLTHAGDTRADGWNDPLPAMPDKEKKQCCKMEVVEVNT